MKKIGPKLIELPIDSNAPYQLRQTVRSITLDKHGKVLLLYSKKYDDYTFPGGGIKPNESHLDALKRELKEELGAQIQSDITPYGFTEELKYGIGEVKDVFLQISYYYKVELKIAMPPHLNAREITQKLIADYVDIQSAIDHNHIAIHNILHQEKGLKTVLLRENMVLKDLKENHIT